MRIGAEPLTDKRQTGAAMRRAVVDYAADLKKMYLKNGNQAPAPLHRVSLPDFYSLVKAIPYTEDPRPVEIVARPALAMMAAPGGLDCKKKAVLIASWCALNMVPWRFVAVSRRNDREFHHVFTQAKIRGQWQNVDPTYQDGPNIFTPKTATAAEII